MSKIYLAASGYIPTTAGTNRFIGMVKAFSKQGIDVDVVFFTSDKYNSEAPALPHVTYHYYWKYCNVKNDRIKNLLYRSLVSRIFINRVHEGDTVYLYGCSELIYRLTNKKGVRVFQERTEHPLVSTARFMNVKKYLTACPRLNGMFVISSGLKEYFKSIGIPEEKIHIVNMTVDPSRFEGLERKLGERYIAYCGKATNNKDGVDQLIKAFAITSKTHPDVKLYIIGTPPKRADESGNIELVESLGISDKVVFTGVIATECIPQILTDAEVLALDRPNNKQAKYGFPTKLGEYLLTGNPVVITRVGDIPRFLTDGESALLARPDCPEDFARKLDFALDHPEKAKSIGLNGKQVALTYFDSDMEAGKVIEQIIP